MLDTLVFRLKYIGRPYPFRRICVCIEKNWAGMDAPLKAQQ